MPGETLKPFLIEGKPYALIGFNIAADPSSIYLMRYYSSIIFDSTNEEKYLVKHRKEILEDRLATGRTVVVSLPAQSENQVPIPVATINLSPFSGNDYGVVELTTGWTAPARRRDGIMTALLKTFNSSKAIESFTGLSSESWGSGIGNNKTKIVFGTIEPDNEKIVHPLLDADFLILPQADQLQYPFASMYLHMYPGEEQYGARNPGRDFPEFYSQIKGYHDTIKMLKNFGINANSSRRKSLAIAGADFEAFVALNDTLATEFRGDIHFYASMLHSRKPYDVAPQG